MPKTSVIMPAYNAEKYIREAIDSILNQTFKDFEFIIVNDGSTDSTKTIIESYVDPRIKIINHNTNQGIYISRNWGLKIAQGEFIANFDSDDISMKNRLEEQLSFMMKYPDIVVIGSWMEMMDMKFSKTYILKYNCDPAIIKWDQILKNQISNPASFFRKKTIDEVGYYRKKYKYAGDYDFWSRISRKYKMSNISKALVRQRVHNKSITGTPRTHKIQTHLTLEVIFNNINYYINISRKDFKIFIDAVKNGKISNFKNFIKVRRFYKDLFNSYIKKENLSKEDIKKILPDYKKKKDAMLKWYVKCLLKKHSKQL